MVTCLIAFLSLNLFNATRTHCDRDRKNAKTYAEVERPQGFIFTLAAFGTLFFFLESIAYPLLAFAGAEIPLRLSFQHDSYVQGIGILLEISGYSLFMWSVLERGRYATSWEMREDHKLVTSGPHRYMRHPSYLAYFLMFSGLFFLLLNLVTLIPLVAIPGYVNLTTYEERLLTRRFGNKYVRYQEETGRFLPKIKALSIRGCKHAEGISEI
ncbi:MAG: isoprenylcysteine carboxylmethyltransferase family protein [Candidatus Bathyarchaeota archaeon]|nr:MAG: isoprenylcysteine carboxylmethyltransferase family protein [Candidatus Bathyarchaeota archaeon]